MTDRSPHISNPEQVEAKLIEEVAEKNFVYVGSGAERRFDLPRVEFNSVVDRLKVEGYLLHFLEVARPDSEDGSLIVIRVLTASTTTYQEVWRNRDKIVKMWRDAQILGKN